MSTAAKEACAELVTDQASVSIIAKGTFASIAAEQASASIVPIAAGARSVLLRPMPHHNVKVGCKGHRMHAQCNGQAWSKWWTSSGARSALASGVRDQDEERHDGAGGCGEACVEAGMQEAGGKERGREGSTRQASKGG